MEDDCKPVENLGSRKPLRERLHIVGVGGLGVETCLDIGDNSRRVALSLFKGNCCPAPHKNCFLDCTYHSGHEKKQLEVGTQVLGEVVFKRHERFLCRPCRLALEGQSTTSLLLYFPLLVLKRIHHYWRYIYIYIYIYISKKPAVFPGVSGGFLERRTPGKVQVVLRV